MIIKNNNRELTLLKSHQTPDYTCKTILSDSVFDYVELWLRNHSHNNDSYKSALFYWRQSKHFYNASLSLPIEARPLTAYYACLNTINELTKPPNYNAVFRHRRNMRIVKSPFVK